MLTLLLYFGVQRAGCEELLGLSRIELAGDESWLVPASVLGTTLTLLLPALCVAVGCLLLGWRRASRGCFVGLSSLAVFLLLLDLDLVRSIGRHLIEVVRVALLPRGEVAAGELGTWLWTLAGWGCLALACGRGVTFIAERAVAAAVAHLTLPLQRVVWWLGCIGLSALIGVPLLMRDGWRNQALYERLYGIMLVDLRFGHSASDGDVSDPQLKALYARLRQAYKTAFPMLTAGRPGVASSLILPTRPPNVVLIVVESLRHDAFTEELMPRLTRWAENGITATAHDSGTIYSESGAFSLLYGRSPALFHQTLDAHVPPQLCVILRENGYDCAYFSGHPKVWMRREEFLNEQTMDRFQHDDRGTWPEWDQRALDGMVQMLNTNERPVLGIVLLMSSHFEYEYPAKYEVDRPVSDSVWQVTPLRTLGPEAQVPLRNRYRNCMRFIDDMVAESIGQLDPLRNLVIFTGDHGESINDDGRYTHGYSFAEIVTRTPLAMVGPGVLPRRIIRPTSHVDVLPSLLHALTGMHQRIGHTQGIDWFGDDPRHSMLEAHSSLNRDIVQTQLRADGVRLRMDFDLRRPEITLLGFEDVFGHLIPTPELSQAQADDLAISLEEQLLALRN